MAEFCSARSETIPPLPWTNFSPPFPLGLFNGAAVVGLAIVFDRVTQSYGRRIEAQRQS